MSTETPIHPNHPVRKAWETYKASPEYANSFRWADVPEHRTGSMWAAFLAGYQAADNEDAALRVRIAKLEAAAKEAREALQAHHAWHAEAGTVIFREDGEDIEINLGAEYADSVKWLQTTRAIERIDREIGPAIAGGQDA